MQILQIFVLVLGCIAYVAITCFVGTSYFKMRQMEKGIRQIFILTMSEHVQKNFEHVQKMKEALQELIADENYKEAAKLKAAINEAEESAIRSLKNFKEIAGDSIREVVVTNKKRED